MNKLFLEIDNRNCPPYPRLKDQELLKKYPNWRYFRYYIMDRSLNKCIFQSINKSEIILRLDLLGYFLDIKNSEKHDVPGFMLYLEEDGYHVNYKLVEGKRMIIPLIEKN